MSFNSYIFILLFLPVTITGYFLLGKVSNKSLSKIWLIIMSLWFYAYLHVGYLVLLAVSIIVNYVLVCLMDRKDFPGWRKAVLTIGIVLNIGCLFYYKYFNFFVSNINAVFQSDISFSIPVLSVGISFITFQQISFLVDCYRDKSQRCAFIDYVVYASFFPKIISGPITLYRDLIPQIQDTENMSPQYQNMARGLYRFSLGLAKKVLIADTLLKFVDSGFADINSLYTLSAVVVMLCYVLYLYFDFSGYSDMAIGVAKMLNIKLPINFNSPFKAKSIADFWKRWHITLSNFLIQYVYIPLGGSRRGEARTCLNIMIMFLLSGFWHGANWTYIAWGCMQGILMIAERMTGRKTEKVPMLGTALTFLAFNFTVMVFRANSIREAGIFFKRLFCFGVGNAIGNMVGVMNEQIEIRILGRLGLQPLITTVPYLPFFTFLAIILIATFTSKNTQEKIERFCCSRRQMAVSVLLLFWSTVSLANVGSFVYANF